MSATLRDTTYSKRDGGFGSVDPTPTIVVHPVPQPNGTSVASFEETEDGGIILSSPHIRKQKADHDDFTANLAIDNPLDGAAYDMEQGVDIDMQSRASFIDNWTAGIDLLGLKIEDAGNTKGQRSNTSRVGNPLLLEACVRGQAMSAAELLPSAGPCKVMLRNGDDAQSDAAAQGFERDMNTLLTVGMPEYYADTRRGLFEFHYSGNMFKKVYEHPIKRRPASDCVSVDDLIVSEDATDLETAIRVTQRSMISPGQVKRMQWNGAWADVMLGQPSQGMDPAQAKKKEAIGISSVSMRPKDMPHTIYECTTELVLGDYGFTDPMAPADLPVTYICTFDKDSRQMLSVRRGWKQGDEEFLRRPRFVHYGMIPAFGFLCLGNLHLLGNQTKVLRAIWRILIDAGMFSNFPGGVKAKSLRMGTNEVSPGPGEWTDVDLGPFDKIGDAFMAMPYKPPSAEFMQLAEAIQADANRLGGVMDTQTGEGRTNVPVGTMMSMIEQSTQVIAAVHKGMHASQRRELELIKGVVADNPDCLNRLVPNPSQRYTELSEFQNYDLLPASDPNVPGQIHRIQIATAMMQILGTPAGGAEMNPRAVLDRVLTSIGVSDVDAILKPIPQGPPPPPPPDPTVIKAQIEAQSKAAELAQDKESEQRKAASEAVDVESRGKETAAQIQNDAADRATKLKIAEMGEETARIKIAGEAKQAANELGHAAVQTGLDHAATVHAALPPDPNDTLNAPLPAWGAPQPTGDKNG